MLEYLPDPVIPYAGARHSQRTEIRLAPVRLCSGGKSWRRAGRRVESNSRSTVCIFETRIVSRTAAGTRPVLHEIFALEPARTTLNATARMGRYSWTASLNICQEGREPAFWRRLEDQLNQLAWNEPGIDEVIWGASTLASRRGDGARSEHQRASFLHDALTDFWRRRAAGHDRDAGDPAAEGVLRC